MNSPDAEPGYRALFPADVPFLNEVAARIALRIGAYRPIRHAAEIACPWLVCVVDQDVITPPPPGPKAAGPAPPGAAPGDPGGPFAIYVGALFQRAAADQVEFLERHLLRVRRFAAQGAPMTLSTRSPGVV